MKNKLCYTKGLLKLRVKCVVLLYVDPLYVVVGSDSEISRIVLYVVICSGSYFIT